MKLSEILKAAKPYHVAFGGNGKYMCTALTEAWVDDRITESACSRGCRVAAEVVDALNPSGAFLYDALAKSRLPHDNNTLALIWDAVIDKLEFDGK